MTATIDSTIAEDELVPEDGEEIEEGAVDPNKPEMVRLLCCIMRSP